MAISTASLLFTGGLGATTVAMGGTLLTSQVIIGGLVFSGVSAVVTSALIPKPKMPDLGSVGGNLGVGIDPIGASEIVYGQARKGGVKTYHETTGDGKYYHYFLTLAMHEVEEIGQIYVNDAAVTVDGSGFVTSDDWNSKILVKKFTGSSSQNIYSSLSGLSNGPSNYTSTFKGQGVACIYVRLEYDRDVFQSGMPLITAVVKGKKLYDPRKDSTSDAYDSSLGVSSHRPNDASTWQYSSNPALAMRDYLTSSQGVAADQSQIDDVMIGDAADDCGTVGSYTENSFEIGGSITTGDTKLNNLNSLIKCFNGTLFWAQGKFRLVAGAYHAPSISNAFTLDDIRGPISIQTRYSRRDLVNTVRGTFVDKDQRWIAQEFPQVQLADMSEDNSVESVIDLELPLVTKSAAAQRLAKQILYTSREQITLSARFSAKAYQVQVGDTIKLTMSRYGWTNKVFLVKGWKATGGDGSPIEVDLTLQETSSTAYQWSVSADEYAAITSNNTSLGKYNDALSISNLAASTSAVQQPDGTVISKMAVTWTAASGAAVIGYDVEWKEAGDTNYQITTVTDNSILLTNLEAGATYNIRVRSFTHRDNRGAFSTLNKVATGDVLAPKAPTSGQKTGGYRTATISWTAPTQNTNNTTLTDLAGYKVYRNTSNSIPSNFTAKVNADRFTDGGLSDATTYYYWVKAFDHTGNDSSALAIGAVTTNAELVDGADGATGAQGPRGAGRWHIGVTSLPTSSSEANAEWDANGPSGDPVDGDQAWFYTGTEANPTAQRVYIYAVSGDTWTAQDEAIDGNLLVSGTITTDKINANAITTDLIEAGAITADKITVDGELILGDDAGFIAGRDFNSDYAKDGFFVGRETRADDTQGFEFSTSSVNADNEITGIIHNENDDLQIFNPKFIIGGDATGGSTTYTSNQTVDLGVNTDRTITVTALGGGGGGGGGHANDGDNAGGTGGAGTATTVKIYHTSVTAANLITTVTSNGGAGGQSGGGGRGAHGGNGGSTSFGSGGTGGGENSAGNDADADAYGAGGGGGGGDDPSIFDSSGAAGLGGSAATATVANVQITQSTNIYAVITLGSGGAGDTSSVSYAGGDGADGVAAISSVLGGTTEYTVSDLGFLSSNISAGTVGTSSSDTLQQYNGTVGYRDYRVKSDAAIVLYSTSQDNQGHRYQQLKLFTNNQTFRHYFPSGEYTVPTCIALTFGF